MDRSSFVVRCARVVQGLPLWLFQFLEMPFLYMRGYHRQPRMLMLLALPRSGSTLTYQVVAHGLEVQYLSNLGNLLYQLPLLGGYASRRICKNHRSRFASQRGFVPGLDGPAEGLKYWQWWMGCGLSDADCERLSIGKRNRRLRYLRSALTCLTQRGAPFASAFLGHTLVPGRVADAFPEAALIRLRRDPVDNALSLLSCMREGQSRWFSVVPCEALAHPDASEQERVAAQVYWLNRRLDDAAAASRYLEVRYEDLCTDPAQELTRIRDFCIDHGVSVDWKWELPSAFPFKRADPQYDQDAFEIQKALLHLEQRHGKLKVFA